MYFSYRIKKVSKLNVDGTRIAVGVCYDHRDITHITHIGRFITGEGRITRVTRRVADEVDCVFLAVFHTVTVVPIVAAGVIPPYAETILAFINLGAVEAVITGRSVVGMSTGSRTITGVIRTCITVIHTHCACRIEAAVRCLLAGVAFRLRTGASPMHGTGTAAAGVRSVTVKAVVTGCGIVRMPAASRTVTGVIRTFIPVIGTHRPRRIKAAVRCFLAEITLRLRTGISPMQAASAAAGIGTITVEAVVTGCRVSRMCAGPRTVTGVIGAHIPVIGTDRTRQIKAAVRIFLAGVALRPRTGVPRVYATGPAAAGVGAVAVEAVITGCGVVWMCAGPRTVTGVIRTFIPVIGTGSP
jgi:hypothetical protein